LKSVLIDQAFKTTMILDPFVFLFFNISHPMR
jgi:hypothetical protein